ncbi:MAG: alpha-galactosidase [Verrucomicrobiae bacterium]|nr:alpha-galactosidase [Verrucomicrobiae bacterium]
MKNHTQAGQVLQIHKPRFRLLKFHIIVSLVCLEAVSGNAQSSALPTLESAPAAAASGRPDWLLNAQSYQAGVFQGDTPDEVVLQNGLVRRTFKLAPNAATIGLDNLMTSEAVLRAVEPEATVTIDGQEFAVGGLRGQPDRAYLLPEWITTLTNDPAAFQFVDFQTGKPESPIVWKRKRHSADLPWPLPGATLALTFGGPTESTRGIAVTVHHEIYDGLPVLGKWLTVSNGTERAITLDRFASERLAVVEAESAVDERTDIAWRTPAITVFSDYMFKGMDVVTGNQVAAWRTDPEFKTQVSYALKTPCRLVCEPPIGPGVRLAPGETFTSFRVWLVVHDTTERERQGLFIRRAHRALAPWSTENPVMMHVRNSDSKSFRNAVDQCAEVGFEMIIYTFGSGLNAESEDPAYLARIKADVDYAHSKSIEVGAYSLFSSRRIDDANDVINPQTGKPGGAIFGNAPCLGSVWGTNYLRKLTNFFVQTGLDLLEHDGPYPGDVCASTNHPGHRGLADSQWVNWRLSADLYIWCRERGIYLNQPDYYFFAGGNKTAMGYREDNWSLPRAQQLIHARQNIFDGTWTKPQTAGWMFVPLTEYHGGGAAATLEPLREHLDAYEGHLANTLGAGVQACWRGPRLYDSDDTKAPVKQWVTWFKQHRSILESDIIHCRRADGRDIDYLLHVNPRLKTRALAMIHNPLNVAVEREVVLPLYYTGLTNAALVREQDGAGRLHELDRMHRIYIPVKIAPHGRTWLTVESP